MGGEARKEEFSEFSNFKEQDDILDALEDDLRLGFGIHPSFSERTSAFLVLTSRREI